MTQPSTFDVDVERDDFMCTLIRELAGALEHIAGQEEANSYISLVAHSLAEQVSTTYAKALSVPHLSREQVAAAIVDFKRRIGGGFYVIEQDDEKIVFGNRACPFTDKVTGRESICMMTSNMLGSIAAQNLGYAKVELQETIARGYPGCRVVVRLRPTAETEAAPGREYYGDAPPPGDDVTGTG